MNDQVILSVAKKNGGLEVTTGGTGQDQLNAIRVAAAATFRVLHGARNLPEEMAAGVISAAVLDGIQDGYAERRRNEGDYPGTEQEVRRSHEREKEPAAGHSPGDGADRLQPGQAGHHVRVSGAGPRRG